MLKQPPSIVPLTALAFVASAPILAADDDVGKDLKATIALHGYPCDEIVKSERNADSDYTASCKDGNRYRVYVNAQGRVVVEKIK
jgi:hypothetical protein